MNEPLDIDAPRIPEDDLLAQLAADQVMAGKGDGLSRHLDADGRFFLDVLHAIQQAEKRTDDAPELEAPSTPSLDTPAQLLEKLGQAPAMESPSSDDAPELEPGKAFDEAELALKVAQLIAGEPPILPQ